jgi:hypothetical protein
MWAPGATFQLTLPVNADHAKLETIEEVIEKLIGV